MKKEIFNLKEQKSFRKKLRNNMPAPEVLLWSKLKGSKTGFKFRRQHGIGIYIIDFYCPIKKLAVEVDGDSHFTNEAENNDFKRDQYLESLGIKVLRYNNKEVIRNIDGVMNKILSILNNY